MAHSILIIEDDETLAANIREHLERSHWEAHVAHSAEEGLIRLEAVRPDVVLTDHVLPGKSGMDVVRHAVAMDPSIKVVMMTGEGSEQVAVEAMKAGACDYLPKPVALAHLKVVLEMSVAQDAQPREGRVLARSATHGTSLDSIIGESAPMAEAKARARQLLEAERRIRDTNLPAVLITGETGTGKELLARALHFEGPRSRAPFVELNCASLPANLLEAELFGHEKGAFTDAKDRRIGLAEAADGGTLFLDEIGEVPPAVQAKLLKLLEEKTLRRIGSVQERRVDIRIISATNRDLERMVVAGAFRSDLYFRLRVITLSMPPLRSTSEDILRIARFYLAAHARRYGKQGMRFSPDAEACLLAHAWPGNVRELRNMLEQTVLLARSNVVGPAELCFSTGQWPEESVPSLAHANASAPPSPAQAGGIAKIADMERELVARTLEKTNWNISRSAKLLGLSRDMLRYRIEKYGFVRPPL